MDRHSRAVRLTCALALSLIGPSAEAQQKVDPRHMHEKCYAVLPMVGTGTMADPRRPLYVPLTSVISAVPPASAIHPTARTGILGYSYQLSDDGKSALVEFVAAQRSAFKDILADRAVKSFVKGTDKQSDIEAEFKKQKRISISIGLGCGCRDELETDRTGCPSGGSAGLRPKLQRQRR